MRVLVTGSTGLIGSALVPRLKLQGHEVVRLVRRPPPLGPFEALWDPATGRIDAAAVEGFDAVIHLSGENLAEGRWTEGRRKILRASRIDTTRLLAGALARAARKPRVLISASAVGYYGNRGSETLRESAAAGSDFLATLCREWEAATTPAAEAGIRVVLSRSGLILSAAGGVLPRMLPVFRLGLGGPLGSGAQWLSWIALPDFLRAIEHLLGAESIRGPVNTVSPGPVTNREFARALGRALGRPAALPVPAPALLLLFGDMARETVLGSQRAVPGRLLETGFEFLFPDIGRALAHALEP